MLKKTLLFSSIVLLISSSLSFATPIDDLLAKTQGELDDLLASKGAILVPNNLEDAKNNLEDARELLEKGKKIEAVEKKIDAASEALRNANTLIQTGLPAFEGVMKAQSDCEVVSASEKAEDTFKDAEKAFDKAVGYLEAQKMDGVRSQLVEAENLYRDAELEAIKVSILSEPERLIKLAEDSDADKYAPASLEQARVYRAEADVILNRDRYAQEEAQLKADESSYQANHAMFITSKSQSTESTKEGFEIFYLNIERDLEQLAKLLNYSPRYDRGFSPPIAEITEQVTSIAENSESRIQDLEILKEGQELELVELRKQLREIEKNYLEKDSLFKVVSDKLTELENTRAKEIKLQAMKDIFDKGDIVFYMEDPNLELEVTALSFVAGKIKIDKGFNTTLKKISEVIMGYNPSEIHIVGHGDPGAAEEQNEALSRVRAETVRDTLIQLLPVEMENRIDIHITFPEELLEVHEVSPVIESVASIPDTTGNTLVDSSLAVIEPDTSEVIEVEATETTAETFTMRKQRNKGCIWFILIDIQNN